MARAPLETAATETGCELVRKPHTNMTEFLGLSVEHVALVFLLIIYLEIREFWRRRAQGDRHQRLFEALQGKFQCYACICIEHNLSDSAKEIHQFFLQISGIMWTTVSGPSVMTLNTSCN